LKRFFVLADSKLLRGDVGLYLLPTKVALLSAEEAALKSLLTKPLCLKWNSSGYWTQKLRCLAPRRTGAWRCSSWTYLFPAAEPTPNTRVPPPRCPWATREGRAREKRGAGRGGERCVVFATGRGAGPRLRGPGRRAPSSPRHHRRHRRLGAASGLLRWGRNWAAQCQWHLECHLAARLRASSQRELHKDGGGGDGGCGGGSGGGGDA